MKNKFSDFIKKVKTEKEIKKLIKNECSIDELVSHGEANGFVYDEATLRLLFKDNGAGKLKLDEKELENYLNKEIDKKFKEDLNKKLSKK